MKHFFTLVFLLVLIILLGLLIGAAGIDIDVIRLFRLPRIAAACLAGAALGLSGAIFQGVLKNPLADPYLLGASAGASVAAAFCIFNGIARHSLYFFILVFAGAFFSVFLSYFIARAAGKISEASIVLSGVAVSAFFTSLLMLFVSISGKQAMALFSFVMGNFSVPSWRELFIAFVLVFLSFVLAMFKSKALDAFSLGEEKAYHLGIEPNKGRIYFFALASACAAAAVSLGGTIGFVGLMVPHIMRIIFTSSAHLLLPASALGGAFILCFADTLGRIIYQPFEIPAGIIMAVFGAPFFLWLLFYRNKPAKVIWGRDILRFDEQNIKKQNNNCIQNTLLEIKHLSFGWANEKNVNMLFNDFSLQLKSGEFLGILGKNGIGKSTLLKLATGFIKSNAEIYINSLPVQKLNAGEIAKNVAWLSGEMSVPYDFSVYELVCLGLINGSYNTSDTMDLSIKKALKASGIEKLIYRNLSSLSSGEKQLAFIAQVIAQKTNLLFLDEPAAHLDLCYKEKIMKLIAGFVKNESNKAAVAVLHEPALAKYCDKILILGKNKFFLGLPEDVLTKARLAEFYELPENAEILKHFGTKGLA